MSELVSGCCSAADRMITLDGPNYKDMGICPDCKGHCTWINLEEEDE